MSWKIFTIEVRKLAEGVRGGLHDPHRIAETFRACADTIDEMDRRIELSDAWIAGTGRFEEFEATLKKLEDN